MPPDERFHILIVDDDPDVAAIIADQLGESGYRVSVVADGVAMRDLLRSGDPVDALIIDSVLHGEQGASLARHAKNLRIPVVMCSGSGEAMEMAHNEHLQLLHKPFRDHELKAALTKALASGVYGQRDA